LTNSRRIKKVGLSLKFKKLGQIGILTKDVEKTAKMLEKYFGVGPFKFIVTDYKNKMYRGKPEDFRLKIGLVDIGPIQIELMQPLGGESVWKEFLEKKGYGLHHIGLEVDSMKDKVNEFEEMGLKIIQSGEREAVSWAYLDTEDKLGVTFELIERRNPSK